MSPDLQTEAITGASVTGGSVGVAELREQLEAALRAAEIEARLAAVTEGPWFYNGYSCIGSQPMVQVEEEFWTEERMNDGHTYDHRIGHTCPACGERPAIGPNGERFGTYWDCARFTDAYNAEFVVAHVPAHHGDTAVGKRVADAAFIAHARQDVPWLLSRLGELEAENVELRQQIHKGRDGLFVAARGADKDQP